MGKALIIGQDSFIGKHYISLFPEKCFGTSRRKNSKSIFLDLAKTDSFSYIPSNLDGAVICAGITALRECQGNQALSRLVNVENTVKLIRKLSEQNIFFVYLSTNMVFDGEAPYPKESAMLCPVTEYGNQKAKVEEFIYENHINAVVLRLTKVVDNSFPIFSSWLKTWAKGEDIRPFCDLIFSPVHVNGVCRLISTIIKNRCKGIYHYSGECDQSYSDVALMAADFCKISRKQVKPVASTEVNANLIYRPENTALSMEKTSKIFKVFPENVKTVIENVFKT